MVSPSDDRKELVRSGEGGRRPPGLQVVWTGAKARQTLAREGCRGKVLAAFSDIIYLLTEDDEILWLSRSDLPRHGRGIGVTKVPPVIGRGEEFLLQGELLQVGSCRFEGLGRAMEWRPATLLPGEVRPPAEVRRVALELGSFMEARGMEVIALPKDPPIAERERMPCPVYSWTERMVMPLTDLTYIWLRRGATPGFWRQCRQVVGLGPGLTPAGDDFLGGLLFAVHWLREAYPGEIGPVGEDLRGLLCWAKGRTHPISYAVLAGLAEGEGPGPLHELISSLLKGCRPADLLCRIHRLTELGQTTGRCMLSGALIGLLGSKTTEEADDK